MLRHCLLALTVPLLVQAGSVHRLIRIAEDLGPADPSMKIEGVTLQLKLSPAKQQDLQHLLAAQQDSNSPDFHRWLTPEQYGARFGAAATDISKVSGFLQSRGLHVDKIARSRNWILFGGPAASVESALGVHIHRYRVDGEIHYANADEPSLPADIAPLLSGFRGLNDFRVMPIPRPQYNSAAGHTLVPDDIATIYDTAPLLKNAVNGTGIKIAIVGGSAIQLSDINAFRSKYNLPVNPPQLIVANSDPGTVASAMVEGDIDVEWSGAAAPNATILYVYDKNPFNSIYYIVDNNAAPIISTSFGACEPEGEISDNQIAQQANAQGMTWIASSGDTGAAFCDGSATGPAASATHGLSVAEPASFPEVTGIGGTTFNDAGLYWSTTNGPNLGSALSYIPEVAWNDTALTGQLTASGGGASVLYPKPLWQNAPGIPDDGARDVPDISFAASPNHDGYQVYTSGQFLIYGGTSVPTPIFAGVVALLSQSLISRGILAQPGLGNLNPTLYRLARTTTNVFHDVTQGNNIVPCQKGSPNCNNGSLGFYAGPGYDQVTGLGSVDAANLVSQWSIPALATSNVVVTAAPNPSYGSPVTISLSETNGGATTLTGFTLLGRDYSSQIAFLFGTATIEPYDTIYAQLGASLQTPSSEALTFAGMDPSGRTWSSQITLQFLPAQAATATTIAGVSHGASFKTAFAPGMIMSVFGANFAAATQSASSLPLPASLQGVSATVNGVAAPLYFVSSGQINLQIPYSTAAGPATLSITGSGGTATFPFTVQANAPGIFAASGALVPNATGTRGSTLLAFITGEGAVSPSIATGATPSASTPYTQLPMPVAQVSVTVGGVNAPIAFVGIPSGLAGVTQINFVVPSTVPIGTVPVIVTVGGISSPAVNLTITQ